MNMTKSMLAFFVMGIYLFLYTPIIVLVLYSFNQGGFPDVWQGFSLHWYHDLFCSAEIWRAFHNSVIVASSSSLLSVSMSVMFVHGMRWRFLRQYATMHYPSYEQSEKGNDH